MTNHFFAVDLGATSGRTILGKLTNGKLEKRELTRFPNHIIELGGHYYWDILALYQEILNGLKLVSRESIKIESIGIDTWGVDVVLFGKDGSMLRNPYSYRDPHTIGIMEEFFKLIPKQEIYQISGIQFMNFNTLFQLFAMKRNGDSALQAADKILFMPDALSYMLTGKMVTEYTILSTSNMMDTQTHQLSKKLLDVIGLQESQFAPYIQPGEVIGTLSPEVQKQTGLGAIPVIAVAGHDTASAIAAIPTPDENYFYLSSGTWSLMGIETKQAIVSEESYRFNFTNEGGIENTTRFLKNICGMWLFESCRKEWSDLPATYNDIYAQVQKEQPFRSLINPDDPSFANPKSMVQAITDFCLATSQPVPVSWSQICRCIYDSLAMRYREVYEMIKHLSPFPIHRLHVIGGGSLNYLLDQFIANNLNLPVYAGPQEATAEGNIMLQAKACNLMNNIKEIRASISQSEPPRLFTPQDTELWQQGYQHYKNIVKVMK